jgi:hypothetical protein
MRLRKPVLVAGERYIQSPPIQSDCFQRLTGRPDLVIGVYCRWHMFEEKREVVMTVEAAVLPLMPILKALAA